MGPPGNTGKDANCADYCPHPQMEKMPGAGKDCPKVVKSECPSSELNLNWTKLPLPVAVRELITLSNQSTYHQYELEECFQVCITNCKLIWISVYAPVMSLFQIPTTHTHLTGAEQRRQPLRFLTLKEFKRVSHNVFKSKSQFSHMKLTQFLQWM